MIVIDVQVNVLPANRPNFLEAIQQDRRVALQFDGCLRFVWSENIDTPNQFILHETWTTQAAFDAYRHSAEFKAQGGSLFPLLEGEPQSRYYTATPLEA